MISLSVVANARSGNMEVPETSSDLKVQKNLLFVGASMKVHLRCA
jgi:hypothetical protein